MPAKIESTDDQVSLMVGAFEVGASSHHVAAIGGVSRGAIDNILKARTPTVGEPEPEPEPAPVSHGMALSRPRRPNPSRTPNRSLPGGCSANGRHHHLVPEAQPGEPRPRLYPLPAGQAQVKLGFGTLPGDTSAGGGTTFTATKQRVHPLLLRGPTVHPGAPLSLRPAAGFIRPTACSLPDSFFPRRWRLIHAALGVLHDGRSRWGR